MKPAPVAYLTDGQPDIPWYRVPLSLRNRDERRTGVGMPAGVPSGAMVNCW